MIANYQFLSDENLESLKHYDEEILEDIEEWQEETELLLDINKMWDVLHFVFTGKDSTTNKVEDNPLSKAVIGESPLGDISEYVAYTEKSQVADILLALENFDIEKAMDNFSMENCKKAELYPDIWDYEDEEEEIKEEIIECFENMKLFYKKILETNGNVLVTIY